MTDRKDEIGKGQGNPDEGPRRPYATIDLQATEVGAEGKAASDATATGAAPEGDRSSMPPPDEAEAAAPPQDPDTTVPPEAEPDADRPSVRARSPFATHLAAGVTGGVVTLGAAALFGLVSGSNDQQTPPEVSKRIAAIEEQVRQRPAGDVNAKLAQTDTRLKGLEEQSRMVAALNEAQNKLAANIKALEARGNAPEVTNRLAKIETSVAALSANDPSGQAAALAEKLTGLEKQVNEAVEASKSASERVDRLLPDVKKEVSALSQRIEALKADVDDRLKASAKANDVSALSAKVTAFDRDLQSFLKSEGERTNNAARVLLALEIANLKRAMDRGDSYTQELKAVQKLAGNTLELKPLQRYADEGVPTLPTLTTEFRQVADAAMDAEAEPSDGSVLDRLMSGARSIVRVRKAGYDSNDQSTEAVLGRMETALKEGRLDEVMAQGGKLPPKAALAAEDWLKKVEARRTVDRAVADIEMAMKTSLAAGPAPAPEPKK